MPAGYTRRQHIPRNYWTAVLLERAAARLVRGGGGSGTSRGARGGRGEGPPGPGGGAAAGGICSALGSSASHPGDAGGGADERSGIMTNTFGPE
ncbi:hypothetical protein I79_024442 [Cricetulus griseus]|uniref:Uncharacterized protein n=1 Tax=Cricetulus griseus TaxID=10029 RepID=G3IKN9_CRIGR|nr:hypothetical protein I79_024442 [Cricetulus griseus]